METLRSSIELDNLSGGIMLYDRVLHPLWLRERVTEVDVYDPRSHQRLYEHSNLSDNITVITASLSPSQGPLIIQFSDGYTGAFDLGVLRQEIGIADAPEKLPQSKSWKSSLKYRRFEWSKLNDPKEMQALLRSYFINAFCIIDETPTALDSLQDLARRFGFLRETNFGMLFNVETKPDPSDLAYTSVALTSHTDNPYRDPIPGIQFLHCLRNEVSGGLSTLVDGMAVAEVIEDENTEWMQTLEDVHVRFRYHGPSGIYENFGPLFSRDHRDQISHIRFSSRLDFVPALDPKTLDLFYAARRRMHELSNDPAFQIQFPFKPGTLLMMNNYRLFHGRTAFNGQQGHRHLQGCYIDQDGPQALYRSLALGGTETYLPRES